MLEARMHFNSATAAPLILKSWALNRVRTNKFLQILLKLVSLAEMKEETGSVITQRSRDCLGCRLVSGGGLLGVGAYISYQSKRANNLTFKIIMNTIALGTFEQDFYMISMEVVYTNTFYMLAPKLN
jgi:Domain of unknown function (DUF4536)